MESADLISRVVDLSGISTEQARRALHATTSSLIEALSSDEAEALERELPAELRALVRGHAMEMPLDPNALFANAGIREAVEIGFAVEHGQCVCRALAEQMSPDLRARLQRHLPKLAPLFEVGEEVREPVTPPLHSSSLSSGHAGSRHPLSEARPERAQSHSVARNAEPHADTKISSAKGIAEEREDRTIATAKD